MSAWVHTPLLFCLYFNAVFHVDFLHLQWYFLIGDTLIADSFLPRAVFFIWWGGRLMVNASLVHWRHTNHQIRAGIGFTTIGFTLPTTGQVVKIC